MQSIQLRDILESDVPIFFVLQQDQQAIHMAAFTAEDPSDKSAFDAHWKRILTDQSVITKTIVVGGEVVGHVAKYEMDGNPEVTYWIDSPHWGKGIATQALAQLLTMVTARPIYARAVKDNLGPIRVLEKNGFAIVGEDKGFADGRHEVVEEYILKLDSA
ncbi:MAG: GNAT family N-acetyltransferase [Anaerolineae bacterium]|nr:GNAT family N-acetyltransferase [Anaerolineae bacterium]